MIMAHDRSGPRAGFIPRALLICGTLSLLLLPALASSPRRSPASEAPALKSQDSPRDERSNARTTQAQTRQKPSQTRNAEPRKDAAPGEPRAPLKVRVAHPIERELSDHVQLAGRIEAGREVELKPRVSGTVIAVHCRPGQAVKEGDVLFEIDPRSYQAELDKAQAEYERAKIHKSEIRNIQEAEASVKVAAAARDIAKLKLEFTRVTAPFAGTITGTVLAAGNVADADRTSLATIIAVDPLYVSFNVPQDTVLSLNRLRREGKFRGDVPISLVPQGEQGSSRPAKLEFADIRIDPNAGTARWRATIANVDQLLLPGMSVTVRLTTSMPYKALLIAPEAVVSSMGPAWFVNVVHGDVAETRQVFWSMSDMHDGLVPVTEGLKPDDWVIIDAVHRIRNGMKVVPERVPMPTGTPGQRVLGTQ